MLSWPSSPPRLTGPAVGLAPSPHVLTARPCRESSEEDARTTAWPHFRVSIQLALETTPKSSLSLPEVFHLIPLPPDLPSTITSKLVNAVSNESCKHETFVGFGCHWL
jgi:hypothetical protein